MQTTTGCGAGKCVSMLAVALLGAILGCARVDVRKVPTEGAYETWGDSQQRAADNIQGVRYYLPRPYVAVNKSFVVGGGDFIVSGEFGDGNIISMETGKLPTFLKNHFPSADGKTLIDPSSVKVRRGRRTYAASLPGQQATGGASTGAEDSRPDSDIEAIPQNDFLTAAFGVPFVLPSTSTVQLTLTLLKGSPFVSVDTATPALVPLDDAYRPLPARHIRVPGRELAKYKKDPTGVDGRYETLIRPSDVKANKYYSAGLVVTGVITPNTAAKTVLIYRDDLGLSAVEVYEANKVAAPKGKEKEKESSESTEGAKTNSSFTSSGDPESKSVYPVNDYLSIVMLQDFEEQYAINVSAGLGMAKSQIGLENGWMLEKAETQIDNRELGKFIFKQVEKFTDIAAEVLKAEFLPSLADEATEGGVETGKFKAEGTGGAPKKRALLRIRYVVEVAPGIYPIMKPGELGRWRRLHEKSRCGGQPDCACESDNPIFVPCPPYTVVAKDVFRRVLVELVGAQQLPPGGGGDPVQVERELSAEQSKKVLTYLHESVLEHGSGLAKLSGLNSDAVKAALATDDPAKGFGVRLVLKQNPSKKFSLIILVPATWTIDDAVKAGANDPSTAGKPTLEALKTELNFEAISIALKT